MKLGKIARLTSARTVVYTKNSHIDPDLVPCLEEIFAKIHTEESFFFEEIDMERIVGGTLCIETENDDDVVYARRIGKPGFTRFIKNRERTPSTKVTVMLAWANEFHHYNLVTMFIGGKAEPEVWDKRATEKSKSFWQTHALIMDGSYDLVPNSETKVCPW
ncbi:MAG: hypothetical protein ABIO57_02920 [Candidatus Paceibacterota bacterium]